MKRVKRLLQVLALLLALLVAFAAYLVLSFDAARVRSELAESTQRHTGRTLTLGGDLNLSFFPRLGVQATEVRLSARGDPASPFASLARVRASLAVLPLLSGRFEVERIEIDGLKLLLRRDADGYFNVDDLTAPPAAAEPAAPLDVRALPRFAVAGVTVRDGELVYEDAVRQSRMVLAGLTLETGRLANQADDVWALAGTVRGGDGDWNLRITSGYRLDLDAHQGALTNLEANANGRMSGGATVVATISAASLAMAADKLRAESLSLIVDAKADAGHGSVQARWPAVTGDLAARMLQLPGFTLTADAALPARAPIHLVLEGGPSEVSATTAQGRSALHLDDGSGSVTWAVERFSPLLARVDLRLNRLDLDRYRSAASSLSSARDDGSPTGAATRIDLSFLRGPEVRGVIELGALTVHGLRASDVQLEYWLHKGRLDLPTIGASLYDGRLTGRASVDSHGNRLALAQTLTGVDLQPLLRDLTGKAPIEGRGDVRVDLGAAGATADELIRSLDGTATIHLRDGGLRGINLAETLRSLRPAFLARASADQAAAGDQKTDFTSLSASFKIVDGVAHNDDLDGRMPLFRLSGQGDIDLGRQRIDYLARASLVTTASGQSGKDLAHLRGVSVPVRLQGPFTQLAYRVEFADLGTAAVKEKLRERLPSVPKDALRGKLQRLFGR